MDHQYIGHDFSDSNSRYSMANKLRRIQMIRIRSDIKVALLFGVLLLSFWIVDGAFRMMNVRSDSSVVGGTAILIVVLVLWFNICKAVWKEVKEEKEKRENARIEKERIAQVERKEAKERADAARTDASKRSNGLH